MPAVLVALAVAVTGCSPAGDERPGGQAAGSTPAAPAKTADEAGAEGDGAGKSGAVKVAKKGGRLGGAGSACELPVTFDLAAHWKPKAVSTKELPPEFAELAELTKRGPVTMVCEIDAKPAGNIGFLWVWQGKASAGDPHAVLKKFVAAEPKTSKATYTQVKAGALAATEVEYTTHSELLDESRKARALAVMTPKGPVVVELGGMDTQEHDEMLPAFELAKRTLKLG